MIKIIFGHIRINLIVIAVLTIAGIALWTVRFSVYSGWENVAYALNPTAGLAYAYGNGHFDATAHPNVYDIDRAEYFYREVQKHDPAHAYVHHQRARIAFLHGQFPAALALINAQINLFGTTTPSSFYVRGLILGFMERYAEAAESFEAYLETNPNNWAAVNDYAWVLLKSGRSQEALAVLENLLNKNQENAWLLNSAAIAAYETGDAEVARAYAERASEHAERITREEWLAAYPGNDPRIAEEGIVALRESIASTMHTVLMADEEAELQ